MINFSCPNCNKPYFFGDDQAGKRVRCTECGATMELPRPQANADDDLDFQVEGDSVAAAGNDVVMLEKATDTGDDGGDDIALAQDDQLEPAAPIHKPADLTHLSPTLSQTLNKLADDEVIVDGNRLVVNSSCRLLSRCVVCGEPVGKDEIVTSNVYYTNRWILLFIAMFCSPLLAVIFFAVTRVPCTVTYGIKTKYRTARLALALASIPALLAALGALAFSAAAATPARAVIGVLLFLFFFTASIGLGYFADGPLRVAKYDGDRFWIAGFGKKYLQAERAARKRQREVI